MRSLSTIERLILALQRRDPDMECKDPLAHQIPFSIGRRREAPVFDFSQATLHPNMKLLRSVGEWQTLQMTEEHLDGVSDNRDPRLASYVLHLSYS
jgi:hypothetical protein